MDVKCLGGLLEGFKYKEMLNWKDEEDNTVLHLAAVWKQHEIMKFLLVQPELDTNAVNSNKLKALDILLKGPKQSNDQEIEQMLHLAIMPKPDNQALTEQSQANDAVINVDTKTKDLTSKNDITNS